MCKQIVSPLHSILIASHNLSLGFFFLFYNKNKIHPKVSFQI